VFLTGFCRTLGGTALDPFERFTENAKTALRLAQEEAERSPHSYIGTEHLLLGILRAPGAGQRALVELGVDIGVVRETIAAVLGRNERIIIQQVIPTSRVKKVIEIAFGEARQMGHNFVDTGHLLIGLVIEGEGIAAHVLKDLGADATSVRATVTRLMSERPTEEAWTMPYAPADPSESNTEALSRLLRNPRIANLLRAKGVTDLEGLGAKLEEPPEDVVRLRTELRNLQQMQHDKRRQLDRAEEDWLRNLTD
jgi:ATP-dependent Clp protease ATP-binding subunit ClpA